MTIIQSGSKIAARSTTGGNEMFRNEAQIADGATASHPMDAARSSPEGKATAMTPTLLGIEEAVLALLDQYSVARR